MSGDTSWHRNAMLPSSWNWMWATREFRISEEGWWCWFHSDYKYRPSFSLLQNGSHLLCCQAFSRTSQSDRTYLGSWWQEINRVCILLVYGCSRLWPFSDGDRWVLGKWFIPHVFGDGGGWMLMRKGGHCATHPFSVKWDKANV
jgi:hypothetical protein